MVWPTFYGLGGLSVRRNLNIRSGVVNSLCMLLSRITLLTILFVLQVTLNQPMLDVDHVTSRLNFLQPRYSTIKGQNLSIPSEYSKRSQRAKVFVIPELCSVHPLPGYIWRQLFILPSVLYRFESLLVAEELRSSVAKALNRGAVEWPNDVPLPLLNLGEMVGEEIVMQRESVPNDPCDVSIRDEAIKPVITELVSQKDSFLGEAQDGSLGTSVVGTTPAPPIAIKKTSVSSDSQEKLSEISESYSPELRSRESFSSVGDIVRCYTELPKALSNMRISGVENPDNITVKNQICQEKPSNGESTSCCGAGKCSLSASEACSSGSNLAVSEHVSASVEKDATFSEGKLRPLEAADSKVSPSTIWTDPRLSRLYRSCGPSSTLILRALTTCSANDTFSLERLEVLGDSFMKYAISASVFFEHRHQNEGKLSFIRGLKVSNRQLLYLARHRDLPSYMITRTFNPLSNWLPPGFYHVVDDDSDLLTTSEMFLTSEKTPLEIKEDEEEESLFVQNEAPGTNVFLKVSFQWKLLGQIIQKRKTEYASNLLDRRLRREAGHFWKCLTVVKRPHILFVVKTPRGNSVALTDECVGEILWCDHTNECH